ncbi:hypothetical protein SAMN04515618_10298 [Collimonas sp. OK307]|uniref:hypothetical protein n=1 Tax=Collimonas sp. OK307 TaxID=1801620 RepID=UPI0008E458B3|nr:hypothetical protein [Collimonas sp. OK307]SFH71833.1 hypothetical protein SAMN04515618_10298 [Collimonas sp. OK307]
MNCVSTPNQIAATLPRPQNFLDGVLQVIRSTVGGARQHPVPVQAAEVEPCFALNLRELNDHLLRDIGYIDSVPPRERTHQDTVY